MQGILACLFILMVAEFSAGQGTNQPYQPECDSWDHVVAVIRESVLSYDGTSVGDCYRLDDCTGMKCTVFALGKTVEIDSRLFPCDDPPQMRILLTGSGVSFEETVTHDSSYTVPGLTYSPFGQFGPTVNIRLVVTFEEHTDGIVIGAKLKAEGTPIEFPLFSNVLIRTPPCTDVTDPFIADCLAMEDLVASIVPPPSCSKMPTCNGISCIQMYRYTTPLGPLNVHANSDMIVDSCSTPISIILKAKSAELDLDWTHRFTHSESVPVDQNLAYGTTLVVNLTMEYQHDVETILTTIKYTIAQPIAGTQTETVLDNVLVPIPECKENPSSEPTATVPTPASDECASWKNIEKSLEFSLEEGYSVTDCVTLPGCRGFNCSAMYDSEMYYIVIEEFHCQEPTYVTVSIDGANEHFAQNFTHNDTVPIPGADGAEVLVHIVQESPSVIFVGVYVLYPLPGGEVVKFPLVSDQLLEVTPCDGGAGHSQVPTSNRPGVTVESSTMKNNLGNPTKFSGGKDNRPVKEPVSNSGELVLTWSLVLGVIAAVMLAVIASGLFVYFRRRRQLRDSDLLMENTDTSIRDVSIGSWNGNLM